MVDVEKMTDAELRAELSVRGENVGPVTGTTRSLYEKKLKKLIAAGGKTPARPSTSTAKPPASANKTISKPPPKPTPVAKPTSVVKPPVKKTPDTSRRSFPRAAANSTINSTFNRSEVEEDDDSDDNDDDEDYQEEEILSPPKSRPAQGSSRPPARPVSSTPTKLPSPKAPTSTKASRITTSSTSTTSTTTRIPTTPRSIHVPNLITDFTPSFSTFSGARTSTLSGDRPGATPPRKRIVTSSYSKVLHDLGNTTGEEDDDDYEGQESSRIIYKSKEPSKGLVKSAWNKVLGYGFAASETPGESYDLRAGASRIRVQKNAKTGKVTVKTSNVCNDAIFIAFYALLILLAVLSVAYFVTSYSSEKSNFLGYWAVLKAAGRDSINFLYNYAILPVISLGLLILFGAGLFFGHRKYKEALEIEETKLYELIERITDLVQLSASDGEPYVSQPHVRDVMFPPAKRRSAEMARWEKAVKFIDTNESRVATDIIVLPSGNECAVWKWIGNQTQKRVW